METIANKDSAAKKTKKLTKLNFFIILLSIQSDIFTRLLEKTNKQTNKQTKNKTKQNKTKKHC